MHTLDWTPGMEYWTGMTFGPVTVNSPVLNHVALDLQIRVEVQLQYAIRTYSVLVYSVLRARYAIAVIATPKSN